MAPDLTKGSVLNNLIRFSTPFFLSYFLQTLYGLADLFIVGQYNGADVITAVSAGSQIMHMMTVIIVGLAMGCTVMISQAVGARQVERVSHTIGNTMTIFFIFSIVFSIVLVALVHPIMQIMSIPAESLQQTKAYLVICFVGIPVITAYNVISSVLRGMGDSQTPMYFVAIACVINIALDYFFIGILDWQAVGAALGTVLSQTCSVLFAVVFIWKKDIGVRLCAKHLKPNKQLICSILQIGFPIALQDGLIQVSFLVITIIANTRGVEIAAAVGIVEKIISIIFLVPSSMLSAVSAIAAQNIGAGKHQRATKTLRYSILITVVFGICVSIIVQFVATPLVGLFTTDRAVIIYGGQYLRSYVFDCIFAGVHFCFSGYFCAYQKSIFSFIHNIASIIAVRIPGAYLASVLFPQSLFPMGIAAPAGSILSALICFVIYWKLFRNQSEKNMR
ncbi:MAG: MATE family efflux transporter [Eubacteriales bacterium]|nr:MATE family efflux transporter [Eubacteriales bacterium]